MASHDPIGVLLVEDHEITRVGLRLTMRSWDQVDVLGEAADGKEALKKVSELKPQVVLMDIAMPIMDGIEATSRIKSKFPGVRIIMLTSHETDDDIFASVEAGADGYCLKDVNAGHLLKAIQTVATGAPWIDPRISPRLLEGRSSSPGQSGAGASVAERISRNLSRQTRKVLSPHEGAPAQAFTAALSAGIDSAKDQMKRSMQGLSVYRLKEAAMKVIREGLV